MAKNPLGEIVLGKEDAPVTIIEYASTTCTHCAHFYKVTFPELQKNYIDTGKVRYIFREFPFNDLDLYAFMLARCAGNDKFLPLLHLLLHDHDTRLPHPPPPP